MADAELDAFIEADILQYLGDHLASAPEQSPRSVPEVPIVFLTRDYERELNAALDADEITKAKRVLYDLKERFDEAPSGTAEKNQIKTLLVSLYERFRLRLDHDTSQDRADVDLARLMRSWGIQPIEGTADAAAIPMPMTAPRPSVPRMATPTPRPTDAPPKDEDHLRVSDPERVALVAHAQHLLDTVEGRLAADDLREAVRIYRETRRDVLAVENGVPDALARRFLDIYARLHEAIASREQRRTSAAPAAMSASTATSIAPPPRSDATAFDRALLDALSARKRDLDAAVHRHDLAEAMRIYDQMRTAALHVRDPALQAQTADKLRLLYDLLTRLRHCASQADRDLSRTVP